MAILVFLMAALCLLPRAHAAQDHVVAVLYFDNNTGDAGFDVLQKGFADMMITDLSAVDGIVVVERDKLQSLLDEIKLQKRSYFDKNTAVKLGKGLGAAYAVTGAFHAMKPTLRIDMRMIDIATGKVVVAAQVTGKESELFELEQELVAKFVTGLKVGFTPSTRPRTRVPDVDTLLAYSKGVDLADKGRYEDASQAMTSVIQRAPTFALARLKRDEILARMTAASARRKEILVDRNVTLARNAETFLASHELGKLSQDEAKNYIAYRVLRGRFIVNALAKHLSSGSVRVVKRGQTSKALGLMKAYYANSELLIKELAAYEKKFTQTYPNNVVYVDTSFALPRADEALADEAGIEDSVSAETQSAKGMLAEFLLLGQAHDVSGKRITVGPPLAELERKFAKIGYQLLDEAWADADAAAKSQPHLQHKASSILETHAEVLFLRGKQDAGIAKLQEILDRYPTLSGFDRYEKRIKEELGLVHNDRVDKLERYAEGLKTCDDMSLRVSMGTIIYQRMRIMGMDAVPRTIAEIEKHCLKNPRAKSFWTYLYSHAALYGGEHDDCQVFDQYMQRYLELGGSQSDAQGYRKNYSKCPAPKP